MTGAGQLRPPLGIDPPIRTLSQEGPSSIEPHSLCRNHPGTRSALETSRPNVALEVASIPVGPAFPPELNAGSSCRARAHGA